MMKALRFVSHYQQHQRILGTTRAATTTTTTTAATRSSLLFQAPFPTSSTAITGSSSSSTTTTTTVTPTTAGRRLYHSSSVLKEQSKVNKLFKRIMWLDMIEVNLLNEEIQKQMGMQLQHGVGGMGGGGGAGNGGAAGAPAADEAAAAAAAAKTTFDLKLVGFDAKAKIKVIKEIRSITGLGLKEAKELVEGAPKVVKKDLKEDVANELKAKLEELGAQVEVS